MTRASGKKRITFVTGSRAEYGLLKPLIGHFLADHAYHTDVIVTGMHLSAAHGSTVRSIEKEGVPIARKIRSLRGPDTPTGVTKSIAAGLSGFADAFAELQPDLLIVLGDRYEIFAAVAAALIFRIPVAHLHGGEITEGAFDDALRHAITKMSHLHFTSTEAYRKRVIQLGEDPSFVFNVGAIGIDNVRDVPLLSRRELEVELGVSLARRTLLVTFHPVTLEENTSEAQFRELLTALDAVPDALAVFTKANADPHGRIINALIDRYVRSHPERTIAFHHLGQQRYLSLVKQAAAVVGNSSSGIIEAPSLRTPTVNIGDRQKGRLKAASVVDCEPTAVSILRALHRVTSPPFRARLSSLRNPYGRGGTARRIKAIIDRISPRIGVKKRFFDHA